jgi:hypothetical protein
VEEGGGDGGWLGFAPSIAYEKQLERRAGSLNDLILVNQLCCVIVMICIISRDIGHSYLFSSLRLSTNICRVSSGHMA